MRASRSGGQRTAHTHIHVALTIACLAAATVLAALAGCGGGGPATPSADSPRLAAALAELDALTAPPGVDAQVLAGLKQVLRGELVSRDKLASAPPSEQPNQVSDLVLEKIAGGDYLTWSYANTGDYDQNGEVSAADLVPIAQYFGESESTSSDWLRASIADGDGNTEVNSADIVPIAQYFGNFMVGYSLYGSASEEGPWTEFGFMSLDDARNLQIIGVNDGAPLKFSFLIPQEPQYLAFQVAPTDNITDGIVSNTVVISTEPAAITGVSPQSGFEGAVVEFTADTTGSLLAYDWDFGGGAEPNSSSFRQPVVTLGAQGSYDCSVTVDNDFGDPATYEFTLTVEEQTGEPVVIDRVTPFVGDQGQVTQFTVQLVQGTEPLTYSWDFGGAANPNTSTEASPSVTLLSPGFYDASVEVDNDHGPPDAWEFVLTVE